MFVEEIIMMFSKNAKCFDISELATIIRVKLNA